MNTTDTLFTLFLGHLHDNTNMSEKAADFIRRVSNIYLLGLLKQGHVPLAAFQGICEDIENEVIEMYRKKTYGFLTLEDYRRHHFAKTSSL